MSVSNLLSASLLLAALSVTSASVAAQSAPAPDTTHNPLQSQELVPPQTTEPNWFDWRIEPHAKTNLWDGLQADQFKPPLQFQVRPDNHAATIDGELTGLCYSMRSYVVARDDRNSDSVHPVKYSTCQPAARYQVKTADLRVTQTQH